MSARKAKRQPKAPAKLRDGLEAKRSKLALVMSLIATVSDAMGIDENLDYHRVLCLAYSKLGEVARLRP